MAPSSARPDPRSACRGSPIRRAEGASGDRPGVARADESVEIAGSPLARGRDLRVHQVVVDWSLDVAEHAQRNGSLRTVGAARERERKTRMLVMLVVDEQVRLSLGCDLDDLARPVGTLHDPSFSVCAEAD